MTTNYTTEQVSYMIDKYDFENPWRLISRFPGHSSDTPSVIHPKETSGDVSSRATTAQAPVLSKTQKLAGRSDLARTQTSGGVRKENKTITKSELKQIIKEELLVILTDDEVEEMCGIDISED